MNRDAQPRVHPDAPVRAFYLAIVGGGAPVNLVSLGVKQLRCTLSNRLLTYAFAESRHRGAWPLFGTVIFVDLHKSACRSRQVFSVAGRRLA